MSLLEKFDSWLVDDVFQNWSDWLMDRFGKTNFFGALVCVWVAQMTLTAEIIVRFYQGSIDIIAILFVFFFFHLMKIIQVEEKNFRDDIGTKRTMSPYRPFSPYGLVRLCVVFLMCVFVINILFFAHELITDLYILNLLQLGALPGYMYFLACTPKPPQPLRLQKALTEPVTIG